MHPNHDHTAASPRALSRWTMLSSHPPRKIVMLIKSANFSRRRLLSGSLQGVAVALPYPDIFPILAEQGTIKSRDQTPGTVETGILLG